MKTITQEQTLKNLAINVVHREHEVASYQTNIDNFTAILGSLPQEWPQNLLQYRNLKREQVIDQVPADDIETVADLLFADEMRKRIIAEKLEQRKAIAIYDALIGQIPEDQREALITAAAQEIEQQRSGNAG